MVYRSLTLVIVMVMLGILACSLVSEGTITDDDRLVREERPALIALAPVQGNKYAAGTEVKFHLLATDLNVGIWRIEVLISLPGEELLLEYKADSPMQTLETVLTWEATGNQIYLASARAFRPNGDPADTKDDIPSNELLFSIEVVQSPSITAPDISTDNGETISETPPPNLTSFPATINSAVPVPVRQGPGVSYEVVQNLSSGDSVEVVGRSEDSVWLVIRVSAGFGWVFRDAVGFTGDVNTLPVIQAP